jgi:hypothetical protein
MAWACYKVRCSTGPEPVALLTAPFGSWGGSGSRGGGAGPGEFLKKPREKKWQMAWNVESRRPWTLTSCAIKEARSQERKLYPTGHHLGPGGSWSGLGVVRGVQLGPWAAGFGGR